MSYILTLAPCRAIVASAGRLCRTRRLPFAFSPSFVATRRIARPRILRSQSRHGGSVQDVERNAWLFRGTGGAPGRRRVIDQSNSGLEYLRYGRIVLDGDSASVATQ